MIKKTDVKNRFVSFFQPEPSIEEPTKNQQTLRRRYIEVFWLTIKMAVASIAIIFIIRGFILIPVPVEGNSMNNTLSQGDMVTMERITALNRFDIIVFQQPDGIFIKRIIGLPGESVSYQDDQLYINGQPMTEPFLSSNKKGDTHAIPYTTSFTLEQLINAQVLGEDEYFVLGDNRRVSKDSRSFGAVKEEDVMGKVRLVYYPINHFGLIE